jgi:hypothetical protein
MPDKNDEAPEGALVTVESLSGYPEGAEVRGEVIVGDYDENGTVIGWHKEAKGGK